eukprot:scaffold649119_cov46-Prasinocladus_malaysianus.AAC.1
MTFPERKPQRLCLGRLRRPTSIRHGLDSVCLKYTYDAVHLEWLLAALQMACAIEIVPRCASQVYDAIAPHFSSTRVAIWPKVIQVAVICSSRCVFNIQLVADGMCFSTTEMPMLFRAGPGVHRGSALGCSAGRRRVCGPSQTEFGLRTARF